MLYLLIIVCLSLLHHLTWFILMRGSLLLLQQKVVLLCLFSDDHTRYDFLHIYTSFPSLIKTQYYVVIKYFCSNLGGEYMSATFFKLLLCDGTIHQSSCTDTPQQNRVDERKYRHIVETTHSLLLSVGIPDPFWEETIFFVVHLINRILTIFTSGLSPYEKLHGHSPDYSILHVFGCTSFVLRSSVEINKLSASSTCIFLSYGEGKKKLSLL